MMPSFIFCSPNYDQINICWVAVKLSRNISNDPNFHLKHPGVPDSSDGSDGTSYALTEIYTLHVASDTYLLYFVVTYTHHQNDTCVTLFAGAAVMLKPFFRRVSVHRRAFLPAFRVTWSADYKPGSTSNHSHVFSLNSHLCIYVSI